MISEIVESILKKYIKQKSKKINKASYNYGEKVNKLLKSYGIVAVWNRNSDKKINFFLTNNTNREICGDLTIIVEDIFSNNTDFSDEFGTLCAEANKKTKKLEITLSKEIKLPQGVKKLIIKGPQGIKYISGPILVI